MQHLGVPADADRFGRSGPWRRLLRASRPLRGRGSLGIAVGLLVLIAYAGLVVVQRSPAAPTRPVTLLAGSWAPFVGPDLDGDGPVAEIVFEVLQQEGFEPRLRYTSWTTAADRVADAEGFATFPYIASEDRRSRFHLSAPIIEFEYVLHYRVGRWPEPPRIESAEDLTDLRIGRAEGYEVWPELDEAVEEFVEFETTEDAFAALAAGDIDLLPEGRLPGRAVLERAALATDIGAIAVLEDPGNPLVESVETLHLMVPRTAEGRAFLRRFDAGLAEVRGTALYADALAGIQPGGGGQLVELLPGPGGVVELHVTEDGPSTVLAPLGTTARVVAWPASFTDGTTGTELERVQVKIANGPLRGRILFAEPTAVRLEEREG